MSTLAKAVWRGDSGSVHYLSSTPEGSTLIVTDPAFGVERVHLDGPCRMVNGGSSYMYESISATGSTRITPTTTGLLIDNLGICVYCAFPPVGQPDRGHDYSLWPHCPSGDPVRRQALKQEEDAHPVRLAPEPDPVPEPEPVPEPVPVEEPEPEAAKRAPRLRSLFGKSSEAVADVDDDGVVQPARSIAWRVWGSGPTSRTQLRNGLPAAAVDRYLQFAQDRNWLDVGREVVARGSVDPRPAEWTDLSQVDGPSWGPGTALERPTLIGTSSHSDPGGVW
jgi:hypothetical protein